MQEQDKYCNNLVVDLDRDGNFHLNENQIFIVKRTQILKLRMDSQKLFSMNPIVLTNIPYKQNNKLKSPRYYEIKNPTKISTQDLDKSFKVLQGNFNKEYSWYCDIPCEYTGSIFIQIVFVKKNDPQNKFYNILEFAKPEWIIVEPTIVLNSKEYSYQQLTIQTLLTKQMGKFENWSQIIQSQNSLGYNAFHFPPVQHLGQSESHYSIKNQLKLNPNIFQDHSLEQLQNFTKDYCENKLNSLTFVDILLNHTSFDSEWLSESRNSYYSPCNTTHLMVAVELDKQIQNFSKRLAQKQIKGYQKENRVETIEDIENLLQLLRTEVNSLALQEYFYIDSSIAQNFQNQFQKNFPQVIICEFENQIEENLNTNIFLPEADDILFEKLQSFQEQIGSKRNGVQLNFEKLSQVFVQNHKSLSYEQLKIQIDKLNDLNCQIAQNYLNEAFDNLMGQIKYKKLDLQNHTINDHDNPFIDPYFTLISNGDYAANNGWILNADPRLKIIPLQFKYIAENFAESQAHHYLRRTIIIWGDLVKLNYGQTKLDSPFLWKFMRKYIKQMAQTFHGLRIDNTHSTPLHVGEYFMSKARKYNPNIHIFCELFTGSKEIDAEFTKKLGANMLVRECFRLKQTQQLSSVLHQCGNIAGNSVGKLYQYVEKIDNQKWMYLQPREPGALLYDLTHDNPSYFQEGHHLETLPKIGLLSFCNQFVGTTKGFDEFYYKNVDVVKETKLYNQNVCQESIEIVKFSKVTFVLKTKNGNHAQIKGSWDNWSEGTTMIKKDEFFFQLEMYLAPGMHEYKFILDHEWICDTNKDVNNQSNHFIYLQQNEKKQYSNLQKVRSFLNKYQKTLYKKYPFIYLQDHQTHDIVSVIREHQSGKKHLTLITRNYCQYEQSDVVNFEIVLPGKLKKCIKIFHLSRDYHKQDTNSNVFLNGIDIQCYEETNIRSYADIFYNQLSKKSTIYFTNMPQSFVCILKSEVDHDEGQSLDSINQYLQQEQIFSLQKLSHLTPDQINFLLFSSIPEEQEISNQGIYHIPQHGDMIYSGFSGMIQILKQNSIRNDLSGPLYDNLRQGNWLIDFLLNRMKNKQEYEQILHSCSQGFSIIKNLPRHYIPRYFTKLVIELHDILVQLMIEKVPLSQKKTFQISPFCTNLLFACYQFLAQVPSSATKYASLTMSAGLPHFSTGWTRCWGRDTFISFRGLLLIPGLYNEARQIILQFAASLRHGLIPNLLDKGINPRYNCRDACWWFIKAIGDYIDFTGEKNIMNEKVQMCFLSDFKEEHETQMSMGTTIYLNLYDIIQQIFQQHAEGIRFREWNAGNQLDWNMEYNGFNISLKLDTNTGFIFGGNSNNCLTWMDKMGSSRKSGSKGLPATPRDGAPVEMTCILKNCLNLIQRLFNDKLYPYEGVKLNNKVFKFSEWSQKIQQNFELNYFIPLEKDKSQQYRIQDQLVRRRGFYRDVIGSSQAKNCYQLRPNVCIGYVLAPELFTRQNIAMQLAFVEDILIEKNSIGIKTLDKIEFQYVSYYDNSDDSDNINVAHGFSYHNGPEWVWLYGYFLRSIITFNQEKNRMDKQMLMTYLANHKKFIKNSSWLSLPEMTNSNGQQCHFSCDAQAWSIACILEAAYEILNN